METLFDELRTALYAIWHRRWLAVGVAWGMCLAGWLVVALIPNSYQSRAEIYVDVKDVLSEQLGIAGDGKDEIRKVRQTLTSDVNLERVINATKLGDAITSRGEMNTAIRDLAKKVAVRSEEDNLFQITANMGERRLSDAENALLARNIVQKLLDIFREDNIAGSRANLTSAISKLEDQLEERKRELEAAEERRLDFEARYPELIGGSETLTGKIQQTRTQLRDIDADLAASLSALAAIDNQLAGTPRSIAGGAGDTGPRAALQRAREQMAQLRARGLKDEHPDVIASAKQISVLERQAAAEGANGGPSGAPNPAYASLIAIKADRQASVEALQSRRAALQSQIASLMASQASEPAVAAEANRISRDYDVLRQNYEKLLQDREELRTRGEVEEETSQFKFDVIAPPVVAQKPIAPNRPLLLLGVLIAGIGAGAAAAFAHSKLASTYMTANALARDFDLPVLGSVSFARTHEGKVLARKRLKHFAAASAALFGLFGVLLVIETVTVGSVA